MKGRQRQSSSKGKKIRSSNPKAMYEVEKISKKRIEDGKIKYLVKWEGYPEEDSKKPLNEIFILTFVFIKTHGNL